MTKWDARWPRRAACKTTETDTMFAQGAAQNRVKLVCLGCPVRTECLADALDNRVEFGVWGGKTERERRAVLRLNPGVRSWRDVLDVARRRHEGEVDARLPEYPPEPAPVQDENPPPAKPPRPPSLIPRGSQSGRDQAVLEFLRDCYPPNQEQMMSTVATAKKLHVATVTFRAAIASLEAQGLITFRRGFGPHPSRITLHSQPVVTRETSLSG